MNWIKLADRLPKEDGNYLVVQQMLQGRSINVLDFTRNLHELDENDFPDECRPGWYDYDPERGFFEWTNVTHWAKLPPLPEE